MSIGGDPNNVHAGAGNVSGLQGGNTTNIASVSGTNMTNSVMEAALLNQLNQVVNSSIIAPSDDQTTPSDTPPDTPDVSNPIISVDSDQGSGKEGKGKGGGGESGQGSGQGSDQGSGGGAGPGVGPGAVGPGTAGPSPAVISQGAGTNQTSSSSSSSSSSYAYNPSQLGQSVAGDIAKLEAEDLQLSFVEADYSAMVAHDSIEDAQTASSGAISEASYAAQETYESSKDQAVAQEIQAAGEFANAGVSGGTLVAGYRDSTYTQSGENADNYEETNNAFKASENNPKSTYSPQDPPNTVFSRENGVIQNPSYDPTKSNIPLNSKAEYTPDQQGYDPQTNSLKASGPVYSESEASAMQANGGTLPADYTSPSGIPNDKIQEAYAKDNSTSPPSTNYAFPKGTYPTGARKMVMNGDPLPLPDNTKTVQGKTSYTTQNILSDASVGKFTIPPKISVPPKGGTLTPEQNTFNDALAKNKALNPNRPISKNNCPPPNGSVTGDPVTRTNGIAVQGSEKTKSAYDPATSNIPLSSREIPTKADGTVIVGSDNAGFYSQKDFQTYQTKQTSSRLTAPLRSTVQDDPGGFTGVQKENGITADLAKGPNCRDHQIPDGSYTTAQRMKVGAGDRLDPTEDPSGEKTKNILQDMEDGGHTAAVQRFATKNPDFFKAYQNSKVPTSTKGTAPDTHYNANGVLQKNSGSDLSQTKLNKNKELGGDQMGVDPNTNTSKGRSYTAKEYNARKEATQKATTDAAYAGTPVNPLDINGKDGIQDDKVNNISASQKRQAIDADIQNENNGLPKQYEFRPGEYTSAEKVEFLSTGKLSNDPGGTKRQAIISDMKEGGYNDELNAVRSKAESGFTSSQEMRMRALQNYTIYSQMLTGAISGTTGMAAAQETIAAAQAKGQSELASAASQQLSSVQQMNMQQGMSIASGAIQAAQSMIQTAVSLVQNAQIRNQ